MVQSLPGADSLKRFESPTNRSSSENFPMRRNGTSMANYHAGLTRLRRSALAQSLTVVALPAAIAGIASIAVGLLVTTSADTLLLIAVVIFALTAVVLVPIVVAPAQILSEFLRIASIDAGLLSGIEWHPDLTLSRVDIPDVVHEGRTGQLIHISLRYKPLMSSQRGPIDGLLMLECDPPLFDIAPQPFELSAKRQDAQFEFEVPDSPFSSGVLAQTFDWEETESRSAECTIRLRVSSRWDLRLFDDPSDREVCMDVGLTRVEPIGIVDWAARMIANHYLCIIPNDQNFNPVIPAFGDRLLGTNLALDSRRWLSALKDGDGNAELLLKVAARMLSQKMASIRPVVYVDEVDLGSGADLKSFGDNLMRDINPAELVKKLQEECDKCASVGPIVDMPMKSQQKVRLTIQDLSGFTETTEQGIITLSLFGFGRPKEHMCLLRVCSESTPQNQINDGVDLARIVGTEQFELMYWLGSDRDFAQSRGSGLLPSAGNLPNAVEANHVELLAALAAQCSSGLVGQALEMIAASVKRSAAVTRGLYVQPTPSLDRQWINLSRLSESLEEDGLVPLVKEVFGAVIKMLAKAYRSEAFTVYNVCNNETVTADRRFKPLHNLSAPGFSAIDSPFDGQQWTVEEPEGDSFVISAVSNDWKTYERLGRDASRRGRTVVFLPLFGPMQAVNHKWHDEGKAIDWMVLPLLAWNRDAGSFLPSIDSDRYRSSWTLLDRLV
jgi:hypothetical protein